MPHLIDGVVRFDEIKGSLMNVETGDEINLPPSAVCVFIILLNSEKNPVERGEFMEQVYLRFGFDMSNNTLNQYISLLRKNIKSLGVDVDVITTIPKIGFCISPDVMVLNESGNRNFQSAENISKRNITIYLMFFTVFFIVLSELAVVCFLKKTEPATYDLIKKGKIGGCDLFLSSNLNAVHFDEYESSANNIAKKYIPCTPGSIYIYDIDAVSFLNGSGRKYLARCTGKPNSYNYAICAEVSLSE